MPAANDPNLIWYATLVVLTVAMAAGSVWMLRVWNDVKGDVQEGSTTPNELLEPLAEAFAAGQMSEEEYRRIKLSVVRSGTTPEPAKPPSHPVRNKPGPEPPPPTDAAPSA